MVKKILKYVSIILTTIVLLMLALVFRPDKKENKENKLENSFVLLGKKENPYPYMKEADYFCLLSEFEGYGMVLEEAKILNKAIIITDKAAREAVDNYKNKEITKILKNINSNESEEENKIELSKMLKIYGEEVPFISLYYDTVTLITSNKLKGNIKPNSYNIFNNIETWYREYDK